ncbi:hypothetical protein JCM10213_005203 [Rhodosporidiobolus nylandii]
MAPDSFAQLKYVCFSWPNTPLLKKDGLAKQWFKSHATMNTIASALGGFPLTVYEAALPPSSSTSPTNSIPELFLSRPQIDTLLASLAESMGPSRAQASWKATAWHTRSALERGSVPYGGIRVHHFQNQAQLEDRFAQLKDANDWSATRGHWCDLKRAQEVWQAIVDGVRAGRLPDAIVVSLDFETWEQNHDDITEVGVTWLRIRADGMFEEKAEHYIVAENAAKRNGRYCPDARDHFQLGTSLTLSTAALSLYLRQLLRQAPPPPSPAAKGPSFPNAPPIPPISSGPLLLLLHDPRGDLVSLAQLDLQMNLFERVLPPASSPAFASPPSPSRPNEFLLDTQHLYSGWSRRKKQSRLEDACAALGVALSSGDPIAAHNAGNDAWGTLRAFVRLMGMAIGSSADEIPASMLAPPPTTG